MYIALLLLALFVLACSISCAQGTPTMLAHVTDDWMVSVGPGTVEFNGRRVTLAKPFEIAVSPPEIRTVIAEVHPSLPLFNPQTGGWLKGAKLKGLITQECTATGNLFPESVVVRSETGQPFVLGRDYAMDGFWATVGRLEGGAISAEQKVLIDYCYSLNRLDSIVANATGGVRLIKGESGLGAILPPQPAAGETALVNIWVPGSTQRLTEENLFPIEPLVNKPPTPVAERLLSKTLAKLRNGEEVIIVAWGDSVTCGGGVGENQELWYQHQFARRLRERFPQAKITMLTAGWGGRNSRVYMDAPRGGEKDFARDVLEPKPDLVTIEFVNDAYLHGEALQKQYDEIMGHLLGIGAEVILLTPHLVRPDWMGVNTLKFDEDPRPYVRDLKQYAAAHSIALADASAKWCRLYRQGIPYVTLEANSINHPDARGHAIFADALMELFPME
ncbi:MAG: GDSL-type esterase/lipase family protein [Candidatus Zipacnadales bacterium]